MNDYNRINCTCVYIYMDAQWLTGKESTCLQRRGYEMYEFDPWAGKNPWRKTWQPTPLFFPGKSHGQRNLAVYSP